MEMTGEFRIPAPRQRVWEGLNDPEILKTSIPGCQTIEKLSDTEFTAKVVAQVGPVKANFGGKVTLSDLDPPQSYTIAGEGNGGVAGFAKGSAKVNLAEDGAATVLNYAVQAHVGGKLAQIGSRLIDTVARKMAENFFTRFIAAVAPEAPAPAGDGTATGDTPPPLVSEPGAVNRETVTITPPAAKTNNAGTETSAAGFRLPPSVWVSGLTAIVVLMLYYFTRHGVTR
jgi:carbon monoxide dehydrogenase subunit G